MCVPKIVTVRGGSDPEKPDFTFPAKRNFSLQYKFMAFYCWTFLMLQLGGGTNPHIKNIKFISTFLFTLRI